MRSRRPILIALGIGTLAPLAGLGQVPERLRLIGWLHDGDPADALNVANQGAFRAGMRDLGYVEGRDYSLETRSAVHDSSRLLVSAAELVALKVDVIIALTTPEALAAHRITRRIPIVTNAGDPVGNGLATSLSHPGSNVTGMTSLSEELHLKRVDLVRQLVPGVRRIGFLYNPDNPIDQLGLKQFESACNAIGARPIRAPARSPGELPSAFRTLRAADAQALVVASRSMLDSRDAIVELAARDRLPSVYVRGAFADAGGLIAYGPDYLHVYRRCAGYVDKIFKGASPGDLPIEQPDKYELVINLRTARALGVKVPDALLLLADKVIR